LSPRACFAAWLTGSVQSGTGCLRKSAKDVRCVPSDEKLSGESQASMAARTAGHSLSMMENHAVSRERPL
jgi:hypothetical protein